MSQTQGLGPSTSDNRQQVLKRGHRINQAHECCFCSNLVRLHIATGVETGQPMTIANRTAHFRRLISENLGVRGSRVSVLRPSSRAMQLGQLPCTVLAGHCFAGMHLKARGRCGDGYARETSGLFVCRIWLLGPSLAQLPTSSGSSLNRLNSKNGCAATKLQYAFR